MRRELVVGLAPELVLESSSALLPPPAIEAKFASMLGDDPVFAYIEPHTLGEFFDPAKVEHARHAAEVALTASGARGEKMVSRELRERIFHIVAENSTWGAPRIHGELNMLGFDISERTVLGWMRKAPKNPEPAKRWAAFLKNHREAIAAMAFFTVPTLTFGVLYGFFVIAHNRRRIIHFNVTKHPTSAWIVQQLREASPYDSAPKYLIFDRGANFNQEVIDTAKSCGIQAKRTSFRSPRQNDRLRYF